MSHVTAHFNISTPILDRQVSSRAIFGPYHRSWDSGLISTSTSTVLEQTQTQAFHQDLYRPFAEIEKPFAVAVDSSDEEIPLCTERIQEDIERCASAMESNLMMDLGGQVLPPVPGTPRAKPRETDSTTPKRQKWSPHRLGAESLGDAFLHDRSFVQVAPPASCASVVPPMPDRSFVNAAPPASCATVAPLVLHLTLQ